MSVSVKGECVRSEEREFFTICRNLRTYCIVIIIIRP